MNNTGICKVTDILSEINLFCNYGICLKNKLSNWCTNKMHEIFSTETHNNLVLNLELIVLVSFSKVQILTLFEKPTHAINSKLNSKL